MAERSLSKDESALWARVMASVRPLRAVPAALPFAAPASPAPPPPRPTIAAAPMAVPQRPPAPVRSLVPGGATLDAGWDRRLGKGIVSPDATLDLHGHTLHSAHALLDDGLERSIRRGDRVLLLVTGRPPRPESERPHARGAIRAAVADWLAGSRHADAIAAVRAAHPRHGGAGALYIVLRRPRSSKS